MWKRVKFVLAGVLAVGVLAALVVTSSALAQEVSVEAPQPPNIGPVCGWPGGLGFGMCGQAGFEAAAKALNLSTDQLAAELWGGRTLAELADRAGVSLTAVHDAVRVACRDVQKQLIEQAVQTGRLSREKADWLIEGLEKGFWGFGTDAWQDGCGCFCRGAGMGLGRGPGMGTWGRWHDWDGGPRGPKGPQGRSGGFMRGRGGMCGWLGGPMGCWQQPPQQPTE
ncbi:MAG: hypothetical protein NZ765_03630 [Anaerolineae bacterium]|nr:hypothetical protein [Anaerolineae bacterium]MDW8070651.1 hypothetical protein [Anaerolineae bacterium]